MHDKKIYSKLSEIIYKKNDLLFHQSKNELKKFNAVINYCLNALDFEYRKILQASFLDKDYPYWWSDKYSTATFYRKRIKAIRSFVLLFETIYENFNDSSINSCGLVF